MAKTELLQVRVDADVKKEAIEILDTLGTNISASINMYLKQIIIQKGIPFEVKIPSELPKNTESIIEEEKNDIETQEETPIKEEPVTEEKEDIKISSNDDSFTYNNNLNSYEDIDQESSKELREKYYKLFHIKK